jgi:serine/threonine protein phosphatase 1
MFSRLFSARSRKPAGPPGYRGFAIGDIHGHADLLRELLDRIRDDNQMRWPAKLVIVCVGDLIDRGPDSAGVLELLSTLDPDEFRFIGLAGNHEEVLLRIIDGEAEMIDQWLGFGGAECIASYGVDPAKLSTLAPEKQLSAVRAAIPVAHVEFLRSLGDTFRFGDYLIVHAGIRPGVPLKDQTPRDLRWIREQFLNDKRDHGFVVVHGHTIYEAVDEHANRIGIDTGAYRGGRLTALAIEGSSRWLLQAGPAPGLAPAASGPLAHSTSRI